MAQDAQRAMEGQREAEASGGSVDACAEPTGQMLAALFRELAGDDKVQAIPLERFGYFLGRWIYLMDAADDLADDLKEGAFNPWIDRLGLEGKKELSPEERKKADQACNQALNATAAQMVLAFNLISLVNFGPILENVVHQGFAGDSAGDFVFAHPGPEKETGTGTFTLRGQGGILLEPQRDFSGRCPESPLENRAAKRGGDPGWARGQAPVPADFLQRR